MIIIIYNKKTQKDALKFNKLYSKKAVSNSLEDPADDESDSLEGPSTQQMDLFSPQDDSLRGPDDNFNERLSNSPDSVKNLNSLSALPFLQ